MKVYVKFLIIFFHSTLDNVTLYNHNSELGFDGDYFSPGRSGVDVRFHNIGRYVVLPIGSHDPVFIEF